MHWKELSILALTVTWGLVDQGWAWLNSFPPKHSRWGVSASPTFHPFWMVTTVTSSSPSESKTQKKTCGNTQGFLWSTLEFAPSLSVYTP